MAKRGYKLQEIVAHASNVNCLNIGKKSSRLVVSGGEDQKVNLWAIGKPSSLLSLPGHTSPVESVTFDSAEVLVVSGASFGVIKLWDLEEAKILRTLTGHRSSCNALQFHPFGEFFASGSSDTSLKLWDVRKKGCIHTYKGHTRGVSTIRFSPDGRWVVSGGADNVVKIWDLTAGKLLHEFKFHEGQIQCIDFHPLEFLLATGSADKTVKFWDLETFEMIGSAGPESTGIRSMTFHPDGKTLFCGLEDSLKVFSWEPIICHDSVDMGWSTLGDLNINEGKLLACSYYHNCIGVWAADISLFGPYVAGVPHRSNGHMQQKYDIQETHVVQRVGKTTKSNSEVQAPPQDNETPEIRNIYVDNSGSNKIIEKRMGSTNSSMVVLPSDSSDCSSSLKNSPEVEVHVRSGSQINNRQFTVPLMVPRREVAKETPTPSMVLKSTHIRGVSIDKYDTEKLSVTNESECFSKNLYGSNISRDLNSHSRLLSKVESIKKVDDRHEVIKRSSSQVNNRQFTAPFIVPRKEVAKAEIPTPSIVLKSTHIRGSSNDKYEAEKLLVTNESECFSKNLCGSNISRDLNSHSRLLSKVESTKKLDDRHEDIKTVAEKFESILSPKAPLRSTPDSGVELQYCSRGITSSKKVNKVQLGRTRSLVERWERREPCSGDEALGNTSSTNLQTESHAPPHMSSNNEQKEQPQTSGRESMCINDEVILEDLMRNHDTFISSFHSRLAKLQVVRYFWQRNDVKGGLNAVGKLPDHSVQADVVSVLIEKMDIVSLELFSFLLPLLSSLLNSQIDRHTNVSLEMLLKLVAIFGPVIQLTMSASSFVGVDLQAERRRECCTQCFNQLQKIKQIIPSVIRRGGLLAKYAQELNLLLEES